MLESEAPSLKQILKDFLNSPIFTQIDLFCQPIEIPQYPISDYYQNGRFQHLEFVMHLSAMYQRADLETRKLELQKKIKEFDKKRDAALAKNHTNIKQSETEREKTHQKRAEIADKHQLRTVLLQREIARIDKALLLIPFTTYIYENKIDILLTHLLFFFKTFLTINNNLAFLKNNFDIKMIDFGKEEKSVNDAKSFIAKCREKQKQLKKMRDQIKNKIQQELNKATEPNTYIIELIDAGNFPLIKVRNGRTVLCVIRNCTVPLLSTADKIDAHPNSFVFARKKEREILELMDKESQFNNILQTFLAQSFYFKVHYCIVDKIDNIFTEGMKYLQSQDLQNCLLCFEMVEYISANNLENIISDITENNIQSETADPLRIIERLRHFAKLHQLKDNIRFQERILSLQILFQVCGYLSDLCNKLLVLAEIGIAIQDIKPSNLLCYCISQQFVVQMGDLKSLVYFENVKGLKNIPFDNFRDLQMLTDAYVTQPKTLLEIASQCLISSLFKLIIGFEPPKKPNFNIDFTQICHELAEKYRWIPEIAELLYKLVLSVPEAGQWYTEVAKAHLEFHRRVITSKKIEPVRKGEFQHYHNPLFDYHIHRKKVEKLSLIADIQQNEKNPFKLFNDVLNRIKMIIHKQSDLVENCLPQGLIENTQFRVNHRY